MGALRGIPRWRLLLGVLCTAASYGLLTGYDALACRYLVQALRYRQIALASFVGYAFSHNVGASFLGGGAIRYRLYSSWGLSASEIATIVAFNGITFWLGFLLLTGLALAGPAAARSRGRSRFGAESASASLSRRRGLRQLEAFVGRRSAGQLSSAFPRSS
jgi:uncharacterized membrane protein YbhN (UPF0104 family)